ncbi:ABC transporter ATP-binding protein [Neobacillus mesonae]|uniref:ABC transporter ATP-binding protein n=1 Tax=Neobacillus mesonae TaxID=1193713 RepID=UPI002572F56B|nr:ABC transporter ATP-binding protein [Neobacillus mesonae]
MELKLVKFIIPYWRRLLLVLLLSIVGTVLFILQPLIGKFIIDEVFVQKQYPFERALGIAVLLLFSTYLISAITRFIYMKTSLQMVTLMRTEFYHHLLNLPIQLFRKRRIGDLTTRLNEDISEIQRLYTDIILQIINLCLTLLFSLIVLFLFDWMLTLFCMILMPILLWGTHKFRNLLFKENLEMKEIGSRIQSFLFESLSSMKFIRSGSYNPWMQNKYTSLLESGNKQSIKLAVINTCAQSVPQFMIWFSTITLVWFLGIKVLEGSLTLGALLAFTAYQANLYSSVQGFAQVYIRIQSGKAAVNRINEFFSIPKETDGNGELSAFHSIIDLKGIHFSYDNSKIILENLSFSIEKGEKIAIIGESGSGKSTLVSLLARIYRPTQGTIYCDGVDIQMVKKESWHKQICFVSHDDPIWFGTIEEFLQSGKKKFSLMEMEKALMDVDLWNTIKQLPGMLKAELSERGVNLSAGQKQRLLLARAILLNPEILVLDEATCHLDSVAEQQIFKILQDKMTDKTIIVITHRLQNIGWVNQVVRMDQGQIDYEEGVFANGRLAKISN